ncbi:MAG TPA: ABC transporter ATP-binding protein [candidate division WOR-3 bacterium]|uniref:ABC transporter ATP-binding protein n=1 Tax=candidate division WOR-3 bacterium TaxID=2052148 RepID=A0A7C0VA48_UNCW3|nr:ABC transporter ATP-binding protein [candidate division WOR-3 bacterium]
MLGKLKPYLLRYRSLLVIIVFLMAIVALLGGFTISMITPIVSAIFGKEYASSGPPLFRFLIDWVDTGLPISSMFRLAIALIIVYGVKFPLSLLLFFFSYNFEQKIIEDLRTELFTKLTHLSLKFHTNSNTGELLSKITNDTEKIQYALWRGIIHLGRHLFMLIVYIGLALWASWRLFLISIVLVPLTLWFLNLVGMRVRGRFTNLRKIRGKLNAMAVEMLKGIKIIKAFNMENTEVERFKRMNRLYRRSYVKSQVLKEILPEFSEVLGAILASLILVSGGILIFKGIITPDKFLIFLGSIVLAQNPLRQVYLAYGDMQHGLANMESVLEVLEKDEYVEDRGTRVLKEFKNRIEYRNVSFSYQGNIPVLKDINLVIKRGETIAIVGHTGSGKTTLVNLLLRFFDPSEGQVLIDGIDIREFTLKSLREKIGYVSQDVILFNDTIRNNILYARPDAGEKELEEAIQRSRLDRILDHFPKGLDTEIGEMGERLSGGEKQLISLARVVLKNPEILVLDEATSALDAESENLLQSALGEILENKTVIVIAHRLSTIQNADRIVVLEKGSIVEVGNHSELLSKNGLYAKLYRLQFTENGEA